MRELNEIETFIDDEYMNEMADMQTSSDYLNPNSNSDKCTSDSGIIYDPEERDRSELSISNKTQDGRTDSGIDSISKIPSIREFKSLSKSSIKSSSVSTVAVPLREMPQKSSKLRSKRYSLPDIDKLKAYNEATKQCTKKSNNYRKTAVICDIPKDSQLTEQQAAIPLVPTEVRALDALPKAESFNIDPKLINKFDGLSQSLYYIDENGSPKIRERFIKQQRILIEKQEQKKREKAARKSLESEASCSCFNFSRLSKKLKELCKFLFSSSSRSSHQLPFHFFFLISFFAND
jgi:glycogen synthase kinase 3 beta